MRDHLTKAVGLHVADEVWESVDRHLFADSAGRRHGAPRVGSWWDFTRIPGRARSHTKATPTWETWRLVGTLDGHLGAHRHAQLPAAVSTAAEAATQLAGTSILAQPTVMPAPARPGGSWWNHTGTLAVVFTGLPGGDVVMPIRLPQGAGQWAHLHHFLADPAVWHKIDLVRVRDRKAPGGWRYYAHLLTHQSGYQSRPPGSGAPSIPADRRAGLDANVSNLALASFPAAQPEQLVIDQIVVTLSSSRQRREQPPSPGRQRALDRSRRNTNPEQYGPSARQRKRAHRRAAQGLPVKQVTNPGGPRAARADGVPLRAYRHDTLSGGLSAHPRDHAAESRAPVRPNTPAPATSRRGSWPPTATPSPSRTAPSPPGRGCGARGSPCSVPACWSRPWPANAQATGGRLDRAGTRTTAMSQHCLCGQRVAKTLAQRTHDCPACGLHADRDIVSAALAACVELTDPDDPATARVDYRLAHALRAGLASQQEGEGSVNRHQPPTPPGGGLGQDRQPPPGGLC